MPSSSPIEGRRWRLQPRAGEPTVLVMPVEEHEAAMKETAAPCELCEGAEQVAKNFGIHSPGRPEIVPCPRCSTQPNPIGDREQLQELLEAVDAHRENWDESYIPKGPDPRTETVLHRVWGDDQKIYAVADRIRDEQKAGS